MKHLLALALAACRPSAETDAPPPAPVELPAGPTSPDGWGAVFWRGQVAWKVGGGEVVVGPRSIATTTPRPDAPAQCGGVAIDGAVPHAVLALPPGTTGDTPTKPAVISAAVVETAAWRLDEVLPARDRYSPATSSPDPAGQRGVALGSVVKLRRYGGPPVLVVSGSRDCTGALALLDREAKTVLASTTVAGVCGTPRVLPPTDIDGDGVLETALFSDTHVLLARVPLSPSTAGLEPVHSWSCPLPEGTGG